MSETNNINKKNTEDTEDVVTDEEVAESDDSTDIDYTEENDRDTVRKLKEKLKQVESEKQEYLNGWQKTRAEYVNSRKNADEEHRDFLKFAEAGLISDILPVIDSFETAFGREKEWESLPEEWRSGIKNIYNQLISVLNNRGLKEVESLGEIFDPNKHEAIGMIPTEKKDEDHKILGVIQKGYILNGKLIRTARVQVGEYAVKSVE